MSQKCQSDIRQRHCSAGSTRATCQLHSCRMLFHSTASQHGRACCSLAYLEVASDSIPLFLIASDARADARNSISRLEPSISLEPATTAAENTCTNWISGGMGPAK